MCNSRIIAEFFIAKAEIEGIEITNLKLQELLYCSQGLSLAKRGKTLFNEDLIVGIYGPELPSIQMLAKEYAYNLITIDAPLEKIDLIRRLDKELDDILNEIWCIFGELSVWELNEVIFKETAWKNALISESKKISKTDLEKCFKCYFK